MGKNLKILRRRQVEEKTGLSRSTLYNLMKAGFFPKPIKIGPRSVGWIESEINTTLTNRIQERDRVLEGKPHAG